MKIKVIHDECGRESLIQQIVESQGHCPWDGKPFNADYTAILTEALETVEDAGNILENALEKIAGMEPEMTLDRQSVLGPVEVHIGRLQEDSAKRKRGSLA